MGFSMRWYYKNLFLFFFRKTIWFLNGYKINKTYPWFIIQGANFMWSWKCYPFFLAVTASSLPPQSPGEDRYSSLPSNTITYQPLPPLLLIHLHLLAVTFIPQINFLLSTSADVKGEIIQCSFLCIWLKHKLFFLKSHSEGWRLLKYFSKFYVSFSKLFSLKYDSLKKKKRISLSNTFGKCYRQYFPLGKFKIHIMPKRL